MSKNKRRRSSRKRAILAAGIGAAGFMAFSVTATALKPVETVGYYPEPTVPEVIEYQEKAKQPGQQERDLSIYERTLFDGIGEERIVIPKTYKEVKFVPLEVNMDEAQQEQIFRICQENDIAFPLVMAVIEHESQFDLNARSNTGDSGLMQINDVNRSWLAELGYSDLMSLEDNVNAGVYILNMLFEKYEGNTSGVLMAYNRGERGARKLWDQGIYETEYSVEIMAHAEIFSSYIDTVLQ